MGKQVRNGTANKKKVGGKKMSHGSFRCKRHPNSKLCRNGYVK